jgi:NADH-quinone oxidoreductase subunit H
LRLGPSRVGPHGLLQPLADVIKLLTKEDLIPSQADKFLYVLAPFLAVALALLPVAVLPFGPDVEILGIHTSIQLTDLNIGVLFLLAISSLGVYGIALAGWSSNSKYAMLGGLRAAAQMVSYELPMALAVAAPLLLANTLSLKELALSQSGYYFGWIPQWNFFKLPAPQFVSYAIFLMAGFAETNRVPFDLPEAENELVAGFHTEYSSLKFACFFMAEYANMITVGCVATLLFLGGWTSPFGNLIPPPENILVHALFPIFWFVVKVFCFLFLYVWVRGTLPRLRYDQLMNFGWRYLTPLAILNIVATSLWLAFR